MAPWWTIYLPAVLVLLGGFSLAQIFKKWFKVWWDVQLSAPTTAAFQLLVTTILSWVIAVLAGEKPQPALSNALQFGCASPTLWVIAVWAMLKWAPGLAEVVGESRRECERSDAAPIWTEEERTRHVREMDPRVREFKGD